MKIWPWTKFERYENQIDQLKRDLDSERHDHTIAKCALEHHREASEKHTGDMRRMATIMHMRGLDKIFTTFALLLFCFSGFGQALDRNLWTTNGYNAQNPVVAVTSLTVSNANSKWTVQPTGTNTLALGIQTNAYGNLYTNQFQLQTIDMRSTRMLFGLFAGQNALTNSQFAVDDSTYIGFSAGLSEPGTAQMFSTGVGAYALASMTNGNGNTAIGQKAMADGTNITSSVAIGSKALGTCLAPARDTFIGFGAGQFALGGDIGGANTGGNRTGIGQGAGAYDSGQNNVWIGNNAGPNSSSVTPQNVTGIGNTVLNGIGSSANLGEVIGANSGNSLQQFIGVLIGSATLNSATVNFGVMIGDNSGQSLSGWNGGTGVGLSQASGWTGTPVGTMLLGQDAGDGLQNESNNICIFGVDNGSYDLTDVFFNNAISATASSFPINLHAVGGFGINVGGAAMGLYGGLSTGNANGGDLNLGVSKAGTSGSGQNLPTTAINVSGTTGNVTVTPLITATTGERFLMQTAPTAAQIGGTVSSVTNIVIANVHGILMKYWSDGTTLWSQEIGTH